MEYITISYDFDITNDNKALIGLASIQESDNFVNYVNNISNVTIFKMDILGNTIPDNLKDLPILKGNSLCLSYKKLLDKAINQLTKQIDPKYNLGWPKS